MAYVKVKVGLMVLLITLPDFVLSQYPGIPSGSEQSNYGSKVGPSEFQHSNVDNGAGSPIIVAISGDPQYTTILSSNRPTTDSPTFPASTPEAATDLTTEVSGPTTVQTTEAPIPSDFNLASTSSTTTMLYSIVAPEESTFPTITNNAMYDTSNESTLLATSTNSLNQPWVSNTNMSLNYNSQVFQTVSLALDSTTVSPTYSASFPNNSMLSSNSSTMSPFITALYSTSNSLGIPQSSQIPTNSTSGTMNVSLSNNSSTLATSSYQTGNMGTVGNQTKGIVGSNTGKTTFDPDPFFKADVPVVAKIYNDDYLLRLTGTMAPLTENASFFRITLPAAIGMIAVVTFCMSCWQTDCFQGRQKT